MCNYKNKSKSCEYPTLFKQRSMVLPIDQKGFCLFHSRNSDWKKANNFEISISELLDFLSNQPNKNSTYEIDFSGFYFIDGNNKNLWSNKKIPYRVNLSKSIVESPFVIKNSEFIGIDFSNATFQKRVLCQESSFSQLVYSKEATFENGLHVSDCTFGNALYFDKCFFSKQTNNPAIDFSFKNCVFNQPVDFSSSVFNLAVSFTNVKFNSVDFSDGTFHKEFFIEGADFNGIINFQRTEFLYTESFGGYLSSVDFKNLKLSKSAKLVFKGKEPFYDQIKGELFLSLKEDSEGIIMFDNFNLNRLESTSKLKIFELEKFGEVQIGKGCRKYRHRTLPKRVNVSKGNQGLVSELTNTFVQFFKNKNGLNLGVEIISSNDDSIELFYFSDENISKEEFEKKLINSEKEMWTLIKVSKQSFQANPIKETLPDKIISTTDTLINLTGLFLKICTRLPVGKISKSELSELIHSTSIGGTPSISNANFESININQTILLGIGNTQELNL